MNYSSMKESLEKSKECLETINHDLTDLELRLKFEKIPPYYREIEIMYQLFKDYFPKEKTDKIGPCFYEFLLFNMMKMLIINMLYYFEIFFSVD